MHIEQHFVADDAEYLFAEFLDAAFSCSKTEVEVYRQLWFLMTAKLPGDVNHMKAIGRMWVDSEDEASWLMLASAYVEMHWSLVNHLQGAKDAHI